MPISRFLPLAIITLAACAKPAAKPAADTTAVAPPPPPPPAARAVVTVLYNQPKSGAAFEKYYAATHLPLVGAKQSEIGFSYADLTQFEAGAAKKAPMFYRQAQLYFPSLAALRTGTATPGFKLVGDDLGKFATGGLTGLIAEETSPPAEQSTAPMSVFTVIYKEPTDTAAFEKYYAETHVPLVQQNAAEIGFKKAELMRFVSNLDGSPRAYYREAQLFFETPAALKAGMATPGFKKVADDLPKFATGGFITMVAHETH